MKNSVYNKEMIHFYNKIMLVPNLSALHKLFTGSYVNNNKPCFYCDRIAVKHYKQGDNNIIRAWSTPSLLDIWYNDFSTKQFVCAIDYRVKDNYIKIEYMNMNDDESGSICPSSDILPLVEANLLNRAMIDFIKRVAEEENKEKVVVDVHNNLRIFNKYYKEEGFVATNRKCSDNPYWIEAEMSITAPSKNPDQKSCCCESV